MENKRVWSDISAHGLHKRTEQKDPNFEGEISKSILWFQKFKWLVYARFAENTDQFNSTKQWDLENQRNSMM